MKKLLACVYLMLFWLGSSIGQKQQLNSRKTPKLIIGLVVDQMRWDFLNRFSSLYGEDGFKKLVRDGFNCNNTIIPYLPTYTAPGHTCIYTGSVPALHGIVANDWYDRSSNKFIYCTSDSSVSGVGTTSKWGKMSPKNLWATTITDELRLSNNFKSKVIGISLKDRASILPAGHAANAAYWYDETVGGFISSTYYMNQLPNWVSDFNKKQYPSEYLKKDWQLLLPSKNYTQSTSDNENFENFTEESGLKTFPHQLSKITSNINDQFRYTPYANTFIFDFAEQAIENEHLGMSLQPDFLTLSISSTDIIGHKYGPNSLEIEDTYVRLDRDIAHFLTYLDKKLGKGNYSLFLTADHGVSNVPAFLEKHKIPAANYSISEIQKSFNNEIETKFQLKNEIITIMNSQVYLSEKNVLSSNTKSDVITFITEKLKQLPFIINAVPLAHISSESLPGNLMQTLINGYSPKRSGDIQFITKPFNIEFSSEKFGTTHGSWNLYDSHIPLIFFGSGFKRGKSAHEYYMTDIAPTIASLLNIQMPDACVGKVIEESLLKD